MLVALGVMAVGDGAGTRLAVVRDTDNHDGFWNSASLDKPGRRRDPTTRRAHVDRDDRPDDVPHTSSAKNLWA